MIEKGSLLDDELYTLLMEKDYEDVICHEGTPHEGDVSHSGRFPYGSGANPYQRAFDLVGFDYTFRQRGFTDEDLATGFGFDSVKSYKCALEYEKNLRGKPENYCKYIDDMRKKGVDDSEIAKIVGAKDAEHMNEHYKYSKAVFEKVPGDYKLNGEFVKQIKDLRDEGYTDKQISIALDINTNRFKAKYSIATNTGKLEILDENRKLMEEHPDWSRTKRAAKLGLSESTLRSMEDGTVESNAKVIFNTADMLKSEMQTNKYIDVGPGTAQRIGIKPDKLNVAVEVLKEEGYSVIPVQVDQLGTAKGNKTTVSALCAPGVTYAQLKKDVSEIDGVIGVINHHTEDEENFRKIEPPTSIDSKRVFIRYAEDGGADKDGLIELRRGVPDISLNKAAYAQVRIAVDGKYYLKGMAMHTDDIPEGYDIVLNSNKSAGTPIDKVFKPIDEKKAKDDPSNPFGTSIRLDDDALKLTQRHYIDPKDGKEKLSAINIVNEEGDWSKWSKNIAAQVLAKQPIDLIKKQLKDTYAEKLEEFNKIDSLTNPVVRQHFLNEFGDTIDKDAYTLKAVALPRQTTKVILPFPNMKENEIYAPGYKDGETVALIRYPHGGVFEIPVCRVNNKYKEAADLLGNAVDAVGIHPSTAGKLSGADFDGDTALVIPIRSKDGDVITKLKTSEDIYMGPYEELKTFNTKMYKLPDDEPENSPKRMKTDDAKGKEMGKVTNLIMDLNLSNADPEEIARAVKYSMVVVDSKKHELDWKLAKKEFGIAELNKKYRGGASGGASTLITKAKSPEYVPYRTEKTDVKNMTEEERAAYERGEHVYNYPKKYSIYKDKETGEVIVRTKGKLIKSYRGYEEKDARNLINKEAPTQVEMEYAKYMNALKALANKARARARKIETYKMDPEAKKKYASEVKSLNDKLDEALANRPLERKAQALANRLLAMKKSENNDLDEEHSRKEAARCLDMARRRVGASKKQVEITDREWEAIQARAISKDKLESIMNNSDKDIIKSLAMPREKPVMTNAQIRQAESLMRQGKQISDIAEKLGVSVSTINNYVDTAEIRHSVIQERLNSSDLSSD